MGPATEDRSSAHPVQCKCKSHYSSGATPSYPKRTDLPRMLNAMSMGRSDISRIATNSKGEIDMVKLKDMKNQSLQKFINWLQKQQLDHGHCSSMLLHISNQHTTINLLRLKSLKQHSSICRQYRSTVSTNKKLTGISGHNGCQHNLMHMYTSLTVSHAPVHLQVPVYRQETTASHGSYQWIWWLPSKTSRVMHSSTPHWKSGSTESSIPGQRHKMIPHPWPWNSTTHSWHTLPKDNPT